MTLEKYLKKRCQSHTAHFESQEMAEDRTLDLVEEEIRRAEALLARDLISSDERRFIIPARVRARRHS